MLKRTLLIVFAGLISFMFIPLSIFMDRDKQSNDLQVRNGVMDLASWDYEHNQRIKLDGEWEFYWNQLLTPEHFKQTGANLPAPTALMKVPDKWNGKIVNGKPLPAHGFATYRMVLKNVPFSGVFALKKNNIRFSSAVYANGLKLFEDGKPSLEATGFQSGNVPQIGFFSSEKGDVEIIIHVANFAYSNAGISAPVYFGEQKAMLSLQQKSKAHELSTFAILAVLALIYLICFVTASLYRKKDYSLLLFAMICLFYAVYNGLIGERVLLMYVPGMSFEVLFKIKDICSIACFIILAVFFYQLKKNIISLKITKAAVAVLGSYIVLIALLPIPAYIIFEPFIILLYESLTIGLLVRMAVLHIKSVQGDRLKSFLLYMAILCITLYSIDLILFSFSLKENLWVGQVYIVAFNMIIVFLVVLRFFEAYHTIDEMKNQLLRLDKIKDDFLSNTSHELKTPLNAIVSITDTLLKGAEGPVTEGQAQNLAIVMGSGRRLTRLVNELLDYSKMKHGDITLYRSNVDLRAAVDSVIKIHLFLLGGKQITVSNRIPEDMPAVYADGNRLIQILHNLIGNAIKFTEQGAVDINAKVTGGFVEIRVSDTGIGIAAHMQSRIFNPFEQADMSETRNYDGTGLGLSITKKLVELHGGEIHVNSNPGEGSVFIVTIPLSDTASVIKDEQPEKNERRLPDVVRISGSDYPIYVNEEKDRPILVVDDDFANLQSMINLLKLEGYSVVAVNSGQMALEELSKKTDFYLVVLDIMMPDMSGYEVLKKLRERFSPFELPVLMLTAKNSVADMVISMDNGANDFVGKPFEAEELMARVRSLTRLKASVKDAGDAEIAFLRSQIKPHFLYNALNSIAELCVEEPEKAEELTLQLSQYLKSSFDFKQLDSQTTLENELELVQAYINIEKARFGARLHVDYDVDVNPDIRIPPLILQPLVENAIRHGLMSNLRGGKVNISVKQDDNHVVGFTVEDNGCGMSEQMLEEVLSPVTDQRGVGLWNINRRIKLLYGKSIRIESAEGKGTKVSFNIPAEPAKQKRREVN